jgi:hypothetical protein
MLKQRNMDKILLQMNWLQYFKLKNKMLAICDVATDGILHHATSNELIIHAERTVELSLQNYCKLINGTLKTRKLNHSLKFCCTKHFELMFLMCTQKVPGLHFR